MISAKRMAAERVCKAIDELREAESEAREAGVLCMQQGDDRDVSLRKLLSERPFVFWVSGLDASGK